MKSHISNKVIVYISKYNLHKPGGEGEIKRRQTDLLID